MVDDVGALTFLLFTCIHRVSKVRTNPSCALDIIATPPVLLP